MKSGGLMGGLYRICEWIMRLAYVNILWIFFTVIGLVIFTVTPATVAMFTVVRKWVMGEIDVPVFRLFWNSFRKEFIRANLLGLILGLIGFILYIDFLYIVNIDGVYSSVLNVGLIVVLFFYIVVLLQIFPVFVHYELKTFQYLKYAMFIGLSFPLRTVMVAMGVVVVYFIITLFPGLHLFFSASTVSYIIMWISNNTFKKIEESQKKADEDAQEQESSNQQLGG